MAVITWNSAVSGLWATPTLWSGRSVPAATDAVQITVDGTYDITIPDGDARAVGSLYQSAGTLTLIGNLTIAGAATIDSAATLNGGSANTITPQGVISGVDASSSLVNNGLILADTALGTLQIDITNLVNNGVMDVTNGGILFLTSTGFANLAGGVLTGGIYEADGNSAIDFATGAYDFGTGRFAQAIVAVNDATIILNGLGSGILGFDPDALGANQPGYRNLQDTLVTNDLAGTLEVIGGADFVGSNTLTNSGVISLGGGTLSAPSIIQGDSGILVGYGSVTPAVLGTGLVEAQQGTLTLSGLSATTAIQVDPGATLNFRGTLTQAIGNDGTIAVQSGTLRLSGAVTGAGSYFINGAPSGAATTLDLATSVQGDVAFNGSGALLKLESPAGFGGQIIGFGAGDTIDLVGLASTSVALSGNTITVLNGAAVVDTLQLVGDYSAASLSSAPDGAGGRKITISGVNPRDFTFEGPYWSTTTLTWSLAQFNYSSSFDTAHPFSHTINPVTQAAEVAAIQLAFDAWSAVSGITFVQVADSSDPATAADIRLGWGDLLGLGGEIGQAAYQSVGTNFVPGSILRMEDPAFTAIVANPSVTGGLQYTGFSSTFYEIATHEIGHALGLGHSSDNNAVMFATALGTQNQTLNASDIAGIQALYGAPPAVGNSPGVTVNGAGGDSVAIMFDDTVASAGPQALADALNSAVAGGTAVPFTYTGGSVPSVPAGDTGVLLLHTGGVIAMPAGYSALAIDASAPVTVSGGAANAQVVLAGSGGLAFNAGLGAGSVFAAGGSNLISVYPGAGSQFIQTGAGNDVIVVLAGDDTVNAGLGSNQILTGKGNSVINSTGTDLISAGDIGNVTINAAANNPVAFFGPGKTVFNGGSGNATVVSTVGQSTINGQGGTQIWLGSGQDLVNTTGADTIIGGSGTATVNATAGNGFVFAGGGALLMNGGSGASTILGSQTGSATLNGGAGSMIDLSYHNTRFIGGTGSGTIAGFGGSITVQAGAGGGVFLGGPAGANSITGGSGQSIILGGGAGDVLTAGTGAGDAIVAGAGAETINAAGSHGADKIYAGTGPDLIKTGTGSTNILTSTGAATIVSGSAIDLVTFVKGNHPTVTIQNFSLTFDYLSLSGFPAGEMSAALAGQSTTAGTETLTLSDGTHIILQGVTGLSSANFL